MLSKEERVNYYLGETLSNKEHVDINEYETMTISDLNNNKYYDDIFRKLLIQYGHQDKSFCFKRGDISQANNIITFVKNRCNDYNDSVLLFRLNNNRHWYLYYNKPKDIPFHKKINMVFWRGTTTGCRANHFKQSRFVLMSKWFNRHPKINIGFSHISNQKTPYPCNRFVKGDSPVSYFLKHKYILSIPGNDKDSGLNWKLNSNSVVLMAKPRITSWLMETLLEPNVHYVLLKEDYSDLLEKWKWCERHPYKCLEIIRNANLFMSQFKNIKVEKEIEKEVMHKYFDIVK